VQRPGFTPTPRLSSGTRSRGAGRRPPCLLGRARATPDLSSRPP
jgi:hypothetical protein